ncbi:hypothetical protein [Exiguobacterium algae]|uniref:hypothetical protein n=1 Tax=Exiguobacterium algae TaxID=2751250 RepID=UPI001BEAC11A|nr:hypothetical protein [Exiguobacterium algae]
MRLLIAVVSLGFACLSFLEILQLSSDHRDWFLIIPLFFSLISLFQFLRHLNDLMEPLPKEETEA